MISTEKFFNPTTNETITNFNANLKLNLKTSINLTSNNFHKKRNYINSPHLQSIHQQKKRDEKTLEKLSQELEGIKYENLLVQ